MRNDTPDKIYLIGKKGDDRCYGYTESKEYAEAFILRYKGYILKKIPYKEFMEGYNTNRSGICDKEIVMLGDDFVNLIDEEYAFEGLSEYMDDFFRVCLPRIIKNISYIKFDESEKRLIKGFKKWLSQWVDESNGMDLRDDIFDMLDMQAVGLFFIKYILRRKYRDL